MESITIQEAMRGDYFKKMKENKYHNKKTFYKGVEFASIAEANYAQQLDVLKKARGKDKVKSWKPHVPYQITVNKKKICTYISDFLVEYENGRIEVVDVKSEHTRKLAVYRLKKKLMKAVHNIDIVEVLF